jgi:hypothetical protein
MGEAAPLRTTQVEALIEQADTQRSGEPSWMPVSPAAQVLVRVDAERWAGTLTMSTDEAGSRRRVVVREYEIFQIAVQQVRARRTKDRGVASRAFAVDDMTSGNQPCATVL